MRVRLGIGGAALLAFLAPVVCLGDILFMDLNNSDVEVAAALQAARARGEKLIVLPDYTPQDRKALTALHRKIHALHPVLVSCGRAGDEGDDGAVVRKVSERTCVQAEAALTKLESQRDGIVGRYLPENDLDDELPLGKSGLIAALRKLGAAHVELSSIVISGHDGNARFGGENGEFTENDLREAFAENAALSEGVRSMMLWGCNTANPASLLSNWKRTLPHVELIGGWDGSAPLGTTQASARTLKDLLIQEKKLTQAKDLATLQRLFKSLQASTQMGSSVCVGDELVSARRSVDLRRVAEICDETKLKKISEEYACYVYAEKPECVAPPSDPHRGAMRDLYNRIQELNHCRDYFSWFNPSPDILIRLIYFDNVKGNFARAFRSELKAFDDLAGRAGLPANLRLEDLAKLTRAQYLERVKKLDSELSPGSSDAYFQDPRRPERNALNETLKGIEQYLSNLDPRTVPFNWIEPASSEKPVSPMMKEGLRSMTPESLLQARTSFEEDRARFLVDQRITDLARTSGAGKELRELDRQIRQANRMANEAVAKKGDSDEESKQLWKKVEELDQIRSKKALPEFLGRISGDLKSYIEEMRSQDYPVEEAKPIFQQALSHLKLDQVPDIPLSLDESNHP